MSEISPPLIVLTTVASQGDARRIADDLLAESLAACIQIDGPIESHYRWEGHVQSEPEWRCVIKTNEAAKDRLINRLQEIHPYTVPQILIVRADSAGDYLKWLNESIL